MNTPETAGGESSELKEGTYAPTAGYEDVGMTLSQEPSEKRFAILIGDTVFMKGTIEEESGRVKAVTEDERFCYVFDVDGDLLRLDPEESSSFVSTAGTGETLDSADGIVFAWTGE